MDTPVIIRFFIGSLLVILGLTIFLLGVDIGITPLGTETGSSLVKTNKLWIVLVAGLILGFFISIAEPGLLVLASQVDLVTSGHISAISILVIVSVGMAVMISIGFLRVFYNIPLYKFLFAAYMLIFGFAIFTSREFLAIAFDASGATTGILALPFILALSVGISRLKKTARRPKGQLRIGCDCIVGGHSVGTGYRRIYKPKFLSSGLDSRVSDADSIIGPF